MSAARRASEQAREQVGALVSARAHTTAYYHLDDPEVRDLLLRKMEIGLRRDYGWDGEWVRALARGMRSRRINIAQWFEEARWLEVDVEGAKRLMVACDDAPRGVERMIEWAVKASGCGPAAKEGM